MYASLLVIHCIFDELTVEQYARSAKYCENRQDCESEAEQSVLCEYVSFIIKLVYFLKENHYNG